VLVLSFCQKEVSMERKSAYKQFVPSDRLLDWYIDGEQLYLVFLRVVQKIGLLRFVPISRLDVTLKESYSNPTEDYSKDRLRKAMQERFMAHLARLVRRAEQDGKDKVKLVVNDEYGRWVMANHLSRSLWKVFQLPQNVRYSAWLDQFSTELLDWVKQQPGREVKLPWATLRLGEDTLYLEP
jgi:hypothetical protein